MKGGLLVFGHVFELFRMARARVITPHHRPRVGDDLGLSQRVAITLVRPADDGVCIRPFGHEEGVVVGECRRIRHGADDQVTGKRFFRGWHQDDLGNGRNTTDGRLSCLCNCAHLRAGKAAPLCRVQQRVGHRTAGCEEAASGRSRRVEKTPSAFAAQTFTAGARRRFVIPNQLTCSNSCRPASRQICTRRSAASSRARVSA